MTKPKQRTTYESIGDRVRIFQRGKIWCANFQFDRRQRRVSLETSSKKEAVRRAAKLEQDLIAGRWQPDAAPISIAEAVEQYLSFLRTEGRSSRTLQKYEHTFRKLQELADARHLRDLTQVNLALVDAFRAVRKDDGKAAKTIYCETVIIRQLITFAIRRDLIPQDPLKSLRLKKPKPREQPCWTREQVDRILAASPADLRPAVTILAETGMRFGELAWLTWADVDRDCNLLHIRPKRDWKPKTGDRRSIPMSPAVRSIIDALPKHADWLLTMPPSPTYARRDRQWSERRLLGGLKRVLRELELPGHLHTFRHSFVSHALARGTPPSTVRQWAGHIDATILAHYTHVHDADSQAAMRRLSGDPPSTPEKPARHDNSPQDGAGKQAR